MVSSVTPAVSHAWVVNHLMRTITTVVFSSKQNWFIQWLDANQGKSLYKQLQTLQTMILNQNLTPLEKCLIWSCVLA